ncbi:hypothetical protein [Bacillus horti]|uniref:Uncharacterized protein n=1 Tax=Caldalkalibacillus horti TaxID=77523 RepID=A0ABT9VVU8_9BACI|nr:hypothetical protein [Bacillus horti]MDQ0164760.1 hypothetical protein [Bacillus horti]
MDRNVKVMFDRQLYVFCQEAAQICHSKEFKQLHKEMAKLYRKKGVNNFKVIAFHDSLYSIYMEQHDGELSSQMRSL